MDPMRDLSVSDSRSDSSSSPILPSTSLNTAQTLWTQNLGDSSFQFGSMMYPITSQMSNSSTSTPLQSSASSFDFSSTSAAQQQYLYQQAAASYHPWAYQAAYAFPSSYQGMYGSEDFKNVALLPATTRSSAATTPTASMSLPWTMSQEGKKKRQPYKKEQISRLEYEYTLNSYLTNKRRADLSAQLMLDEKQVKVWFQNRRMKDKKLKQRISGPFPHGAPVTPCIERLIN